MAVYSLWVINKAGGLVYQKNFAGVSDGICYYPLLNLAITSWN